MDRSLRGTVYSSNCVFQQRIRKGTAGSPLAPSYPRRAQEPTPLPEARLHQKLSSRAGRVKSRLARSRFGVGLVVGGPQIGRSVVRYRSNKPRVWHLGNSPEYQVLRTQYHVRSTPVTRPTPQFVPPHSQSALAGDSWPRCRSFSTVRQSTIAAGGKPSNRGHEPSDGKRRTRHFFSLGQSFSLQIRHSCRVSRNG